MGDSAALPGSEMGEGHGFHMDGGMNLDAAGGNQNGQAGASGSNGRGDDNDNEDDAQGRETVDKNGPDYVNLRGIVGRVHYTTLTEEELKILEDEDLWPASKTEGKFFHEFTENQINTLAKVRDMVWNRQVRKEFPDNDRLRQEMEQKRQQEQEAHREALVQDLMHNQPMHVGVGEGLGRVPLETSDHYNSFSMDQVKDHSAQHSYASMLDRNHMVNRMQGDYTE
eukprot:CAMPEP_0171502496 /NCGR_PEP_ID=MMETSP0958-20121227/10220_1 /TAXON_ID=87120 /ORGANISM="Aurantiochytrium limacinum, Strain ATCCMYA-1381" /LENGTH=224 /DNA_ID=CAMNT_0012037577 /DNA_START=793 /DNA_END=1467 /DNA_ORIENTATION=+